MTFFKSSAPAQNDRETISTETPNSHSPFSWIQTIRPLLSISKQWNKSTRYWSSIIAFEKCGGFYAKLTGNRVQHPQSTFWSFWLVQTHFDIEIWKPFCTQHHTKMASNSGDDWRSMAFRQKVLSQMYVLVISRRKTAFVKQRVSFIVWLCQQTVI